MISRRTFLRTAAPGTGAVLAACGKRASTRTVPAAADVALLTHALELEQIAVAAYTAGIPLLSPSTQRAAKQFLVQELAHSGAVSALIKQAGGKTSSRTPTYNLGARPRSEAGVLALLHRIERETIAFYLDTIPRLSTASARAKVASILANEAQHLALVRQALGLSPVPVALVTGSA